MATWQEAVRAAPGGSLLLLEATPGAQHDAFPAGYNGWRNRVRVRVQAPAVEGKANDAVCGLVAATFGVPRQDVRLQEGERDRRKTVFVPLPPERVVALLAGRPHAR